MAQLRDSRRSAFRPINARRAGNAGLIASMVIALAGAALGAFAAYLGEFGAVASAEFELRQARAAPPTPNIYKASSERAKLVRRVIERSPPERFAAPSIILAPPTTARPQIAIIIDDIGLDPDMAVEAFSLPGPVSYSILPYAADVEWLAHLAASGEGDVMLHLPMEPDSDDDPGPNALRADMGEAAFLRLLEWNLSQFDGYVGVNNHMGSKLTADSTAMKTVLSVLARRGVYFLDSKTTNASIALPLGVLAGIEFLERDVFLDPTPEDAAEVARQLRLAERIAVETGYAVAIGHPRRATLDVLGPWLATAEARGFELIAPSDLLKPQGRDLLVSAPALRG